LVVEDEPYMAEAIRDGLRLEAIAADIAGDGDTALELLSVNGYDIAVLDRDIPEPSGDEITQGIVASGSGMPILMLTAADRLDDKATGFELGADDYLTKPFELRELLLRLRALDPGAPDTRHPCERSQVCGWIRSAARSTATAATSRSPASSSPCSKSSSPLKAVSSAPRSS
jgi:two-component system response regulator VanR